MESGKAIINQLEKRATSFVTPATTEHRAVQTISSQPEKQQDASQEERKCPDPPFHYSNAHPNLVLQQRQHGTPSYCIQKRGIRKLLQKEVDPLEEKMKFKEIRSIRNKGLAIDFATDEQAERLI
ncbi:hypothetical protein AVEN_187359-1 [Araneus ventricosus]|uniref:Uncharacterized protein n=1 Tax=Araneus ventricosus TaxID=182803 RepID=A0A4Y2SCS2_ARAVE|nr:hypothetical protein AVEN_187359-1 [Araneus ventricosus]